MHTTTSIPDHLSVVSSDDVTAWLKAHAEASGIDGVSIIATTNPITPFIASVPNGSNCYGLTVEAAIVKLRGFIGTPEQRAAKLREQAAVLLAQAQTLSPTLTEQAGIKQP